MPAATSDSLLHHMISEQFDLMVDLRLPVVLGGRGAIFGRISTLAPVSSAYESKTCITKADVLGAIKVMRFPREGHKTCCAD